jgi:hypothetical protein
MSGIPLEGIILRLHDKEIRMKQTLSEREERCGKIFDDATFDSSLSMVFCLYLVFATFAGRYRMDDECELGSTDRDPYTVYNNTARSDVMYDGWDQYCHPDSQYADYTIYE